MVQIVPRRKGEITILASIMCLLKIHEGVLVAVFSTLIPKRHFYCVDVGACYAAVSGGGGRFGDILGQVERNR